MASLEFRLEQTVPRAALERLQEAMSPEILLKVIGARLLSYVDDSFRTRGRGKWKPLAWSTLALRKRGGDQPLQDMGKYKQSYVLESNRVSYVEVGTNLRTPDGKFSLGRIHEEGTGAYIIRTKRARVLAAQIGSGANAAGEHGPVGFISSGKVGRWMFFGKEVHHPGVPARPVLPENQSEAEGVLRPVVEELLERALKT